MTLKLLLAFLTNHKKYFVINSYIFLRIMSPFSDDQIHSENVDVSFCPKNLFIFRVKNLIWLWSKYDI